MEKEKQNKPMTDETQEPESEERFAEITVEIEVFFRKPWLEIAQAVTSHDALLKAAKKVRASFHDFLSDGRITPYESPEIDELDKAIAQAEGN